MPDTLNILLQSDENYAPFAGVMLTSLFENNKNISEINIYILTVDMSQKNRSKFSDLAKKYYRRIMILDASKIDKFCETNSVRKWKNSYTAYYRLFALSIINEDIDRLIYLDSDMLVLKELIDLTKINLGDNVVGMCLDSIPETHKKRIGLKTNYYYNSGMILFNVKRWLTEGWMNKIVRHICNVQNRYPLPDQDLLNIILEGKILTLPITYNTHSYLYIYLDYNLVKDIYGMKTYYSKNEFELCKNSPIVIHCFPTMTLYPWNIGNEHPFKKLWNQYLLKSPWANFIPIKSKKEKRYKMQQLCYKILPHKLYAFIHRSLLKFFLKLQTR